MKAVIRHICLLLLAVPATVQVAADSLTDTIHNAPSALRLKTPQEAYELAVRYTGFTSRLVDSLADSGGPQAVARLELIPDDNTPFLSQQVIGRELWKVTFDSVVLDLPSWNKDRVRACSPKRFHVLLDPNTGQLIRVYTTYEGHDIDLPPEPQADAATETLRQTGEVFLGFASEPPPIPFLKALDMAIGSSPLKAKEIIAVCVFERGHGLDSQLVWSVIGRGIPPLNLHEIASEGRLSRERTVVDATTGEPLFITNRP